jgi:hypothetical protein
VTDTNLTCGACGGRGYLLIRGGCTRIPCSACRGLGVVRLSPPGASSGIPSSGGNHPSEGGEGQIKKWIGIVALLLLCCCGCDFEPCLLRCCYCHDDASANDGSASVEASDVGTADSVTADLRPIEDRPLLDSSAVDLPPVEDRPSRDGRYPSCPAAEAGAYSGGGLCPGFSMCYAKTLNGVPVGICWVTSSTWYVSDCAMCAGIGRAQ